MNFRPFFQWGNVYLSINIPESFSKVDAANGDVGAAFPRSKAWLELSDLGRWAGLIPIQPGCGLAATLVLDLARVRALAPSAVEFLRQGQALAAVGGHLLALVDQDVDVLRVVQRLHPLPDHGEGGGDIGLHPRELEGSLI